MRLPALGSNKRSLQLQISDNNNEKAKLEHAVYGRVAPISCWALASATVGKLHDKAYAEPPRLR